MYWAYTTMTTVGYGDISSTTMAEKLWAIITMIVSGFFFSFVVGRMASVVAKLDSHRTAFNEKLEVVTTFLKDTDLPRHLSKRYAPHGMVPPKFRHHVQQRVQHINTAAAEWHHWSTLAIPCCKSVSLHGLCHLQGDGHVPQAEDQTL